jgi:hypothetical protein
MQRNLLLFIILLVASITSQAQLSGADTVMVGINQQYVYMDATVYDYYTWTAPNGITSGISRVGPKYFVTVKWNSVGTGTLSFKDDADNTLATKTVIVQSTPPQPNATIVKTYSCGTGTTTLSYTTVKPSSTTWYWQTSASGTSTANSANSYNVTSTNPYYLRAYCAGTWSLKSKSLGTIAPAINPAVPTSTTGTATLCGPVSTNISALPTTNANTIRWYSASSGGTPIATATSYATPSLSTTTPYYASSYNSTTGCESSMRAVVTITVNPSPATPPIPSVTANACGPKTLSYTGSPESGTFWYWQGTNATGQDHTSSAATAETYSASTNAKHYLASRNTYGCWSSSMIPVSIQLIPTAAASGQTIFSGQKTSISISNPNNVNNTLFNWIVTQSNTSGAAMGGGSSIAQTLNALIDGSATYTITPSANGCNGTTITAKATVYASAVITAPQTYVGRGANVIMDAGTGFDSYAWRNQAGTLVNSTQTFSTSVPDTYTVTVTRSGLTSLPSSPFTLTSQLGGVDRNYVVTNTVLVDNITDPSTLDNLPIDQLNQSVAYFDALGRPEQTVVTQGSPLKKDLISTDVYDAFGRENKKYLPIVGEANGRYKSGLIDINGNYAGVGSNFYNSPSDKIADDTRPFNETIFESSPLNRPLLDFGTGANWYANNKSVNHAYLANRHGTDSSLGQEQIIVWVIDPASGLPVPAPTSSAVAAGGYYASGQLSIKSTKDEQGHEVREYIDKLGHTILKKVQAEEVAPLTYATKWAHTYYIYDDLGHLVMVLSPEAVNAITR